MPECEFYLDAWGRTASNWFEKHAFLWPKKFKLLPSYLLPLYLNKWGKAKFFFCWVVLQGDGDGNVWWSFKIKNILEIFLVCMLLKSWVCSAGVKFSCQSKGTRELYDIDSLETRARAPAMLWSCPSSPRYEREPYFLTGKPKPGVIPAVAFSCGPPWLMVDFRED